MTVKTGFSTNGRKVLNSSLLVLDTMIALRMLSDKSPYKDLLQRIKEKQYRIAYSTPVFREWITKARAEGMPSFIILRKFEELKEIDKVKKCNFTLLSNAQMLIKKKRCRKPNDDFDLKYIELSLAVEATLITEDRTLLDLDPYNCGNKSFRIIKLEDYLLNS